MLALFCEDFGHWARKSGYRSVIILLGLEAGAGGLTMLRPELTLEILAVLVIGLALLAGNEKWTELTAKEVIRSGLFGLNRVIFAKLSAAIAIAAMPILFSVPLVGFSLLLWGAPWRTLAVLTPILLTAALNAAGIGFWSRQIGFEDQEFLEFLFCLGWLGVSWGVTWLRPANPFFLVWKIAVSGGLTPYDLAVNFGFTIVWISVIIFAFRWKERHHV